MVGHVQVRNSENLITPPTFRIEDRTGTVEGGLIAERQLRAGKNTSAGPV